jgi:hypothetical protein
VRSPVAWHVMTSEPEPESAPGPDTPPPVAADTEASDRWVALLLAVAAIVAAVITLVAVNSSSDASSAWQSALRQEVARGVNAVNDIHYVYEVEAPGAYRVATSEVQAQEYRSTAASAAPDIATQLDARAQVLEMSVDALRPSIEMAVPAYALPAGGYDTLHRLADRLSDPTRDPRDPDGAMATGDAAAARADRLMDSIVIVGFAFLFGALAQTFARSRRWLLALGWVALGAGIAVALMGGLML